MEESRQRELAELRALMAKYGPASVLGALGAICAEAVQAGEVTGDDAKQWAHVATGAQDIARSILTGTYQGATVASANDADLEELEDDQSDTEDPDQGDEGLEDDPEDDQSGEDLDASAAAPATPPAAEASRDGATVAPEEEPHAPEGANDRTESEGTTMAKDSGLGPRNVQATAWRCHRIAGDGQRTGERLKWAEGNIRSDEWSIKCCSIGTILERWGEGNYIVQYLRFDDKGVRRPCGRSRVLDLFSDETKVARETAPPPPPAPMPAPPAPVAPAFMAGGMGGDFASLFSIMTYMNEQTERTRAMASAESRLALDRANVEAKLALERYKVDREHDLERLKIESSEKLAAIQANARFASRAAGAFDPDTLMAKFGEVVGVKLQEHRDEEEYEEAPAPAPAPPAAPAPSPVDPLSKLIEALSPIIPLVLNHFQAQAAAASAAGLGREVDHAAE